MNPSEEGLEGPGRVTTHSTVGPSAPTAARTVPQRRSRCRPGPRPAGILAVQLFSAMPTNPYFPPRRDEVYPPWRAGLPFAACHGEVRASERRRVQSALRPCSGPCGSTLLTAPSVSRGGSRRAIRNPQSAIERFRVPSSAFRNGTGLSPWSRFAVPFLLLRFLVRYSSSTYNLFPINHLRTFPEKIPSRHLTSPNSVVYFR